MSVLKPSPLLGSLILMLAAMGTAPSAPVGMNSDLVDTAVQAAPLERLYGTPVNIFFTLIVWKGLGIVYRKAALIAARSGRWAHRGWIALAEAFQGPSVLRDLRRPHFRRTALQQPPLSLLYNALLMMAPWVYRTLDEMHDVPLQIVAALCLLAVAVPLQHPIIALGTYLLERNENHFVVDVRNWMVEGFQRIDDDRLSTVRRQSLPNRIMTVEDAYSNLSIRTPIRLVEWTIQLALSFALLVEFNGILAAGCLVAFSGVVMLLNGYWRRAQAMQEELAVTTARTTHRLEESFSEMPSFYARINGHGAGIRQLHHNSFQTVLSLALRKLRVEQIASGLGDGIHYTFADGIIVAAGYLWQHHYGIPSAGAIWGAVFLAGEMRMAVSGLFETWSLMLNSRGELRPLEQDLEHLMPSGDRSVFGVIPDSNGIQLKDIKILLKRKIRLLVGRLEIEPGELVVIQGPPGSGKSLLLKTLGGATDKDLAPGASIQIGGQLPAAVRPSIGWVPSAEGPSSPAFQSAIC